MVFASLQLTQSRSANETGCSYTPIALVFVRQVLTKQFDISNEAPCCLRGLDCRLASRISSRKAPLYLALFNHLYVGRVVFNLLSMYVSMLRNNLK